MLGLPGAVIVDSVNEKTRAIADDSTDSAGFTCPGFHLPRRDETYRFLLFNSGCCYKFYSANIMVAGESRKSLQAFLLHDIAHPVIGNIDRHLEKRRGE